MASAVSFGLAASAVRPVAHARRTATVRASASGPHRRPVAVPCPGVYARPGSLLGMTRRGSVRARNVVTNDKDSSKEGPLDVVEIEECLSVRTLAVPSIGRHLALANFVVERRPAPFPRALPARVLRTFRSPFLTLPSTIAG